jgi:hypothetical protein
LFTRAAIAGPEVILPSCSSGTTRERPRHAPEREPAPARPE